MFGFEINLPQEIGNSMSFGVKIKYAIGNNPGTTLFWAIIFLYIVSFFVGIKQIVRLSKEEDKTKMGVLLLLGTLHKKNEIKPQ